MTTATLTLSYKRSDNFIYQTIIITPTKKSHLRYFTMSKYVLGRRVDDYLDDLYIGDGENIFFREKQHFRNQVMIKYEMVNEIEIDLTEKKFHIEGPSPKSDGCLYCQYLRMPKKGMSKCVLYKKFLPRLKVHCVDFNEKD